MADTKRERCSASVHHGRYGFYPCMNAAKVARSGRGYCKLHDPEAIARREAKRHERWEAEDAVRSAKWVLESRRDGVVSAVLAVFDALPPSAREAVRSYRDAEQALAAAKAALEALP